MFGKFIRKLSLSKLMTGKRELAQRIYNSTVSTDEELPRYRSSAVASLLTFDERQKCMSRPVLHHIYRLTTLLQEEQETSVGRRCNELPVLSR